MTMQQAAEELGMTEGQLIRAFYAQDGDPHWSEGQWFNAGVFERPDLVVHEDNLEEWLETKNPALLAAV